jgi:hypothetical protein
MKGKLSAIYDGFTECRTLSVIPFSMCLVRSVIGRNAPFSCIGADREFLPSASCSRRA